MSFWKLFCCSEDANRPKSSSHIVQRKLSKAVSIPEPEQIVVEKIDRYEGEQYEGKPNGNGSMIYANGDYFRGEWVMGIKEGRGLQVYNESDSKYEGEWKSNLPNGHGKLILKNGSYFLGEFHEGEKNGKGEFMDFTQKKIFIEIYDNGKLLERKEFQIMKSKEEEFPTLALDKERFNSQDLVRFEDTNPEIREFGLEFLLKYYGLCKIIQLEFIDTNICEWTIKQVLTFLAEIGLKDYLDIFYKNKVKGKDLLTLQESQMKEDLKMKLGDRKRLVNYIKYLESIYRPKKQKKKKSQSRRKKSSKNLAISHKIMAKQINSVQNPIQEESDEEWNDGEPPSYITEKNILQRDVRERNKTHNFATEDWNKYNSTAQYGLHSLDDMDRLSDKSRNDCVNLDDEKRMSDEEDQNEIDKTAFALRKISEDKDDVFLKDHIGHPKDSHNGYHKDHHNGYNVNHHKDYHRKSQTSSSGESQNSSDGHPVLVKGKSKSNPMEIRQLYEFLKEHTGMDFLIKPKDIEIQEKIGEGGYGKVYRGKYISCPVAVKDYMKAGRVHKSRQDFMKEVEVLSDLKHPNIVLYMGMCITADKYQLITEYLDNGSLFDQLHKKKKKFTSLEEFQFSRDIVQGMVYLHNMKNMLHRDLKSSNVLLSEDWKVKLCDFGLSGRKKKTKKKKHRIGTYQWMAPEVIRNEEIDFASDVYSFGVVVWELLSEKMPYEGLSQAQIIGLVGYDQNHRLEPPQGGDPFLVELMEKCLNRNSKKRPTFMQIQEDFNQIQERQKLHRQDSQ